MELADNARVKKGWHLALRFLVSDDEIYLNHIFGAFHHFNLEISGKPPNLVGMNASDDLWTKFAKSAHEPVPATPHSDRHSIHSYYLASPESPDGRYLVYYTSQCPDAGRGDLRILNRLTEEETVIAENIVVEDAHRAACQQWLDNGNYVVWHEEYEGTWRVMAWHMAEGRRLLVAENRQVGFGSATGSLLPLHGCHWNPGEHCDLEIWDARGNTIATALTAKKVVASHESWVRDQLGAGPCSIFFPVLSPDTRRVIFKLALGSGGGDFRNPNASRRKGLFCASISTGELLGFDPRWGHPAWHPDSERILNIGYQLWDPVKDRKTPLEGVPSLRNTHPSFAPDGTTMVADGFSPSGPVSGQVCEIFLANWDSGGRATLAHFDNSNGADSWRRNHPHPVFSPDGGRIYFNCGHSAATQFLVLDPAI